MAGLADRTAAAAFRCVHDADGWPFWFCSLSSSPSCVWCWCWCTPPSNRTASSSSATSTRCKWAIRRYVTDPSVRRRNPVTRAECPSTPVICGGRCSAATKTNSAKSRTQIPTRTLRTTGPGDSESKWWPLDQRGRLCRSQRRRRRQRRPGNDAQLGNTSSTLKITTIEWPTITSRTSLLEFEFEQELFRMNISVIDRATICSTDFFFDN